MSENINAGWEEYGSGGVSTFIRPNALKAGDVIHGTLDRIEEEMGKFKKPCLFLRLSTPLAYEKNTYDAGEVVAVNMPGQLKRAVDNADITKGTEIRLTYSGMETVNSGEFKGSEAHTFKLQVRRQQAAALAG